MARAIVFFGFVLLCGLGDVSAQKEGNVWMLGYNGVNPCCKMGFDFNNDSLIAFSLTRYMNFVATNASICDTSGTLLFYTNGYQIANGSHDSIMGSAGFNPSQTNPSQLYLNINQATLILPVPDTALLYYVFHVNAEVLPNVNDASPLELRCTVIDMKGDSNRGQVVDNSLNKVIYEDTLTLGRLTATKHANGKDWWLISHTFWSNEYLIFLVTSDSIYGPKKQKIGPPITDDTGGSAVFSPDGSIYANVGWDRSIDILRFDRCFGNFYSAFTISIFDTNFVSPDTLILRSCEFSPNGQYLYVNNFYNLYQIEVGQDSATSQVRYIDSWDGTYDPTATYFGEMKYAPDGKIYVATWNGGYRTHVINKPNLSGILCDFQQGLVNPEANVAALPNLVNYTLDSLPKYYCDSIFNSINDVYASENKQVLVYPNPTNDLVNLILTDGERILQLQIFSIDGKLMTLQENLSSYATIDCSRWNAGLYIYRIISSENKFIGGKFLVGK